jgi:internalin A
MKKINLILLFILLSVKSFSQTVPVPDANFRQFLLTNYPTVMDAPSEKLIIANAYTITSVFNCEGINISDFTGLEHFKNVPQLIIRSNKAGTLPVFTGFVNLQVLDCSNNKLSAMPSLNGAPNLQDLICHHNQLSSLPDLSTLTNLQTLACHNNQLSSFPDLSNLTNLQKIDCSNNQFTSLPDISNLINLQYLFCNHNQLGSLPDLSSLTFLQKVIAHNNQLTSAADFSSHVNLTEVRLEENKLTFADFIPSINNPLFATVFTIAPQQPIGATKYFNLPEKNTFSMELHLNDTLSSNRYNWYKDGVLQSSTSTPTLLINDLKTHHSGNYTCEITNTNPKLSSLTLVSFPVSLTVTHCKDCNLELTPNDDGFNDTYYIEAQGITRIYDREGKLVKELTTPAFWDGTTSSGELATSGFYLIEINKGKHIKIFVIR